MYLLRKDRSDDSLGEWDRGFRKYAEYLEEISSKLPFSARCYAKSDWHYDHMDPRCPHDSWVRKIEIIEGDGSADDKVIRLVMLGAYHDRNIEIRQVGVVSFKIERSSSSFGDWLYDEVRLSGSGDVLHEIEFENGCLIVVCRDIFYEWSDITGSAKTGSETLSEE